MNHHHKFELVGGPLDGMTAPIEVAEEELVLSAIRSPTGGYPTNNGCQTMPESGKPQYRYVLRGRYDGVMKYDFAGRNR